VYESAAGLVDGRYGPSDGRAQTPQARAAPAVPGEVGGKFSRPRPPPAFVPRPRLVEALDAGARHPVTLVSAGAGWGKTVLVASWAATGEPPGAVAWLSVDQEDNTPGAFWSNVVAALRATGAVPADSDLAELGVRPTVNEGLIARITAAVDRLRGPVVLVLDDLDAVGDPRVLSGLGVLLRYQPDQLRLILVTRSDPPLALHRLRAAGLLAEIRAADLEFTAEEAAELLAQHGMRLGPGELRAVLDRTEGWAAGLRLAAIYLTTRTDRRDIDGFAGDKGAVADYLIGEVLAHQPPEVRRFLLYTSIVDQLTADLADTIVGGSSSQAMLEQLERSNAFVIGLGEKPGWFRYHGLLTDLLRHLLAVEEPDVARDLHLRAADWYSRNHAAVKAVLHAAAAEDWPLVGRLVGGGVAPFILSGDREALVSVLRRLPPQQLDATAELNVCGALLMFDARDYDAIPRWIADARRLLAGRAPADREAVEMVLRSLEVAIARVRGDMPALVSAASDILRRLADVQLSAVPSMLQYRAIALNNKGVGLLWTGALDRADRYLWSAVMAARAATVELVEINASGHLALVEYVQGALGEARYRAESARELAERRGWSTALQVVAAYLALALTALERNDLTAADEALTHGLDAHHSDPEVAQWIGLRVAQIRLLLARQELEASRAMLARTRREAANVSVAQLLHRWLALAEAELDLAADRPDRVAAILAQPVDDGPVGQRERVCLARAALAVGDLDRADDLLAPVRDAAMDLVAAVEAWVVTALIAESRRRGTVSADAIAAAVALAAREGIRRPFVAISRRQLIPLLERHLMVRREADEFVADLLADLARDGAPAAAPALTAELSDRERDVLRYLPTMFSAGEIAAELHVSVNTIKAHLRSIYRKLDVSRRRDAVEHARALGILS
jgi:LuxR family maltose regulon positive regulatory protein